jgi:hypothetical protein
MQPYHLNMQKYLSSLFLFLALFITSNLFISTFALELTNIGGLSLGGKKYTEWWYSGVAPIYSGSAAANSKVTVKVGTTSYDATANASGNWSVATVDTAGDYDVVISGDSTTYAFKLHLGQNVPSDLGSSSTTTTATSTPVPNTGSNQIVALMFSLGILLLSSYLYFWGSENNNAKFEKYFLNS